MSSKALFLVSALAGFVAARVVDPADGPGFVFVWIMASALAALALGVMFPEQETVTVIKPARKPKAGRTTAVACEQRYETPMKTTGTTVADKNRRELSLRALGVAEELLGVGGLYRNMDTTIAKADFGEERLCRLVCALHEDEPMERGQEDGDMSPDGWWEWDGEAWRPSWLPSDFHAVVEMYGEMGDAQPDISWYATYCTIRSTGQHISVTTYHDPRGKAMTFAIAVARTWCCWCLMPHANGYAPVSTVYSTTGTRPNHEAYD